MQQFTLYASIIITALILNTIGFVVSILLLTSLPANVTNTVKAYAAVLIAIILIAWLILLIGGAFILAYERAGNAPMRLKLGIMLTTLFLYTIVFVLSCILLSIFQSEIDSTVVTSRNCNVTVLVFIFIAWVFILTGSALLAKESMQNNSPRTPPSKPRSFSDSSSDWSTLRAVRPTPGERPYTPYDGGMLESPRPPRPTSYSPRPTAPTRLGTTGPDYRATMRGTNMLRSGAQSPVKGWRGYGYDDM